MRREKVVFKEGDVSILEYTPSVFKRYFDCANELENELQYRNSITHKLQTLKYIVRGGYKILYLLIGLEPVCYIAFTKSGNDIFQGSESMDLYIVVYYTFKKHRGKGYATFLSRYLINNYAFKNIYKCIDYKNYPSIKVSEKVGFKFIGKGRKTKGIHRIVFDKNNKHLNLYKLTKM